jgi:hypothetical protein
MKTVFLVLAIAEIVCLLLWLHYRIGLYFLGVARHYYKDHDYAAQDRPWRVWIADVIYLRIL